MRLGRGPRLSTEHRCAQGEFHRSVLELSSWELSGAQATTSRSARADLGWVACAQRL